MADSKRTYPPESQKPRKLRYFFLNGKLHKALHINRGTDVIMAWSYSEHKRIGYTYSDVRRRAEPAFTTLQVGRMVNRGKLTLINAISWGRIEAPEKTYSIDEKENSNKFMWSEKNIMDLHSYLMTVHKGHPRNDGMITPMRLPTARELRAMIHQDEILYVKRGDKFVPTFDAWDF